MLVISLCVLRKTAGIKLLVSGILMMLAIVSAQNLEDFISLFKRE